MTALTNREGRTFHSARRRLVTRHLPHARTRHRRWNASVGNEGRGFCNDGITRLQLARIERESYARRPERRVQYQHGVPVISPGRCGPRASIGCAIDPGCIERRHMSRGLPVECRRPFSEREAQTSSRRWRRRSRCVVLGVYHRGQQRQQCECANAVSKCHAVM